MINASHDYDYDEDEDSSCDPGLLLPVWKPQDDLSTGDRMSRGLVYLFVIFYISAGLFIITPRFMGSIKMICSKKEISSANQTEINQVWHPTFGNVLLLTMGSSGARLFLVLFYNFGRNFALLDFDSSVVVGPSAFNLLIGLAICVFALPEGEVKIAHFPMFAITATLSIFAYYWILVILLFNTPGVVDLWEAVVTLLFFPIMTLVMTCLSCYGRRNSENRILCEDDVEELEIITWKQQFIRAITVHWKDSEKIPTWTDNFIHYLTLPWKVIVAIVPPHGILGGFVTFLIFTFLIAFLTLVLRDLTFHMRCTIGMNSAFFAMIGVIGTNIIASRDAAIRFKYADVSLNQLLGSNVISAFLGVGGIFTLNAIYHEFYKSANDFQCQHLIKKGHPTCFKLYVDPGSVGNQLGLYYSTALAGITIILLRHNAVAGQLGGPARMRWVTATIWISIYLFYGFMTALEEYGVLQGF